MSRGGASGPVLSTPLCPPSPLISPFAFVYLLCPSFAAHALSLTLSLALSPRRALNHRTHHSFFTSPRALRQEIRPL